MEYQTISQLSDEQLTAAGFMGKDAIKTVKQTVAIARKYPEWAKSVTLWMLECQRNAAEQRALSPTLSPTLSDTPSVSSQISVLSMPSTTPSGQHLISDFERLHWYNGISFDPPELRYRSNLDTVKFPVPEANKQLFFELPVKTAEGVFGTALNKVWDTIAPLIVSLFDTSGVKYSAFHPARFSTYDTDHVKHMGPIVIWVATHPGTTTPEQARDISPSVLAILVEHGVDEAVVEWIEGTIEPVSGPCLMPTVENTNPTHDVRRPFTALHGMGIAAQVTESKEAAGTVSIFFHQGGDSNAILGATCKHVVHAIDAWETDYNPGDSITPRQHIRLNGINKMQRATADIQSKVAEIITRTRSLTEDIARLESAPTNTSPANQQDREEALVAKRAELFKLTDHARRLQTFFNEVMANWSDPAGRKIGDLDWAPPRCVPIGQDHLCDMASFILDATKFSENFVGNVIDLGSKYTLHELNTIFGADFPSNMKLRLHGTLDHDQLVEPTGTDEFGYARTVVGKDGNTTGLTSGHLVGLEAYLCSIAGIKSRELAIYNGSKFDVTNFAAEGDSGAPVWTADGKLVGIVHSGMAKGHSRHVTYATPGWLFLERLQEHYPNAHFWADSWTGA